MPPHQSALPRGFAHADTCGVHRVVWLLQPERAADAGAHGRWLDRCLEGGRQGLLTGVVLSAGQAHLLLLEADARATHLLAAPPPMQVLRLDEHSTPSRWFAWLSHWQAPGASADGRPADAAVPWLTQGWLDDASRAAGGPLAGSTCQTLLRAMSAFWCEHALGLAPAGWVQRAADQPADTAALICSSAVGSSMVVKSPGSRPSHTA